jgi:cell wall integrity and stress response component
MVSISHVAAIAASCLLFVTKAVAEPAAQVIPGPTATFKMAALTSVGCFSTATPMVDHGPYTFQSKGNCQGVCWGLQMPVMGVVNGTNCWCGSLLPPNITQVGDSDCDTTCGGIDTEFCKFDQYVMSIWKGFY